MLTYSSKTVFAARALERLLWLLSPMFSRRQSKTAGLGDNPTIVLVEPFQMGDVLSLAVMFDPILNKFPNARLIVWCHTKNAEVFKRDTRVAAIVHAPFPWSSRGSKRGSLRAWLVVLNSCSKMRELKPDAAIDMRGDIRSQAIMLLAGCTQRIGYTTYVTSNMKLRGLLLTTRLGDPPGPHRLEANLFALAPLLGETPKLSLPALQRNDKPAAAEGIRTVVIHVGAGWFYRRWTPPRWARLIERLEGLPQIRVLQVAGPGEIELAHQIVAELTKPIETVETTFEQLLEILAGAALFIGLDSGPMNAAVMLDVPIIALFGPGMADMWRPLSRNSVYIQHIEDYPCHPCTQIVCVRPNDSCMKTIKVDEVFDAAVRILSMPESQK